MVRLKAQAERGFTLVELAIVLVIIGLIIGGVVVGQVMIKAAQINAQITQLNQFNTGVGAFRLKYNCLPGDCATITGYLTTAGVANGNGDDLVTDSGTVSGTFADFDTMAGELLQVFLQLGGAGLAQVSGDATLSNTPVGDNFPKSRMVTQGIVPVAINGINYWFVGLLPTAALSTNSGDCITHACFTNSTFTPYQAYQIDVKIDDGKPNQGSVLAKIGTSDGFNATADLYTAQAGSATKCYDTGIDAYNNTVASVQDTPLCVLQFRWNN